MNVLVVAGAGTSIELGVPGMAGLADEFIQHSKQWNIEPAIVQQILGESLDIEHLIEEVDHICTARDSLQLVGHSPGEFETLDTVRAEIEWFIQHAAERIVSRDADLVWGSLLRAASQYRLTIVTTNYDRAIELAAHSEQIRLDDGFGNFDQKETAAWVGFGRAGGSITLVKLHGSTDWYADATTGNPIKLRHPMPLFGRATLRLPDGSELGSALILPSREKLLTRDPYPRLSQAFLNAADECDVAIVIGSSLRDHHLRGAIQTIARRVAVYIVNPEGSTYGIEGGHTITQSASAFLMGTIPKCKGGRDMLEVLESGAVQDATFGNVLAALGTALDTEQATAARCGALEELDGMGVSLDVGWLRQVLECPDAHVARYALGLVPQSVDRAELLAIAEGSPHIGVDAAYQEDLGLLRRVMAMPLE